jgi:hypothetical protein
MRDGLLCPRRPPKMIDPLVRELAAEQLLVAVTCRVLGFSKQAYYKWLAHPVCQRDWNDARLINATYGIHDEDPVFGYRFIADELRERGLQVAENRVARLCSQQRMWSVFANKPGLNRKAGPQVHDDLVDRQFTAPAPNLLWLNEHASVVRGRDPRRRHLGALVADHRCGHAERVEDVGECVREAVQQRARRGPGHQHRQERCLVDEQGHGGGASAAPWRTRTRAESSTRRPPRRAARQHDPARHVCRGRRASAHPR